ncbi:hypothetical protein RGN99_000291 [Acinetobacter baumannii]|nr:hypothetical protein [Acinetobacter baumannii]
MKLLGLKESDEKKLREGLAQLRTLHDYLSSTYSLRSDLKDLVDNRFTLRVLLQDEINKITQHQKQLNDKTQELIKLKDKLDIALSSIENLEQVLLEDENGYSRYNEILDITDKENIRILQLETAQIKRFYSELFEEKEGEESEGELSKVDRIKKEISEISKEYNNLFEELNDDGENKFTELYENMDTFITYYKEIFEKEDPSSESKKDQINSQLNRIQNFYDKIYGNKEKDIESLKDILDTRLENLSKVEERAKAVIGLSSEAGLAGGFVVKGREAKIGQIASLFIFIIVVLILFFFNLYFFDKKDFVNMKWDSLIFKFLINVPLIWIATIANINLNRFSRLEQEYSHKEALAKSYERYKTEIDELEKLGVSGSEELKLKLLEINLDAFKVNPADHSDKAKPDFSIFDLVKNKNDSKTET